MTAHLQPAGANAAEARRRVAVHEAGHAIVLVRLAGRNAVSSTGIGPRLAGHTDSPLDRFQTSEIELRILASAAYGGMLAEREVLGGASLGSATDLEHALAWLSRLQAAGLDPLLGPLPSHSDHFRSRRFQALTERALRWAADAAYRRAELVIKGNATAIIALASAIEREHSLFGNALDRALESAGLIAPGHQVSRATRADK